MNTRNKPCPCGSGSKHKKCCLAKQQEQRKLDSEPEGLRRNRKHKKSLVPAAITLAATDQLLDCGPKSTLPNFNINAFNTDNE